MVFTQTNPGTIAGASNIIKGSTTQNVTIKSNGSISFTATITTGYVSAIYIESGSFSKLNGETVTLKGTLALTGSTYADSDTGPSSSLTVAAASGSNGILLQATGSEDMLNTIMGTTLTVSSGTLYINDFDGEDGHAKNITLVVTTAQKSESTSSFCGNTYVENVNTGTMTIPAFNNNGITMGGFSMMKCISTDTDLTSFYTTQSIMVVVKNTNLSSSINVTMFINSSDGFNDIYYFGDNIDTIAPGGSTVYMQLATGIFTQMFGS